jgi:hypothetical protein
LSRHSIKTSPLVKQNDNSVGIAVMINMGSNSGRRNSALPKSFSASFGEDQP